jgi:hypothetical protein
MDSTFVVVALAGLILLAVGAEAPSAYANVFEVMSELITEPRSVVDFVHIITFGNCWPLLSSI